MTYDDECDWRQAERPAWRRESQARPSADRLAREARPARPTVERPARTTGERFAPPPAARSGADGVNEISAMVDRIITKLDAVDRRRADAPVIPPAVAERRPPPPRQPRRDAFGDDQAVPEPARPFTEALQQRRRGEDRRAAEPAAERPLRAAAGPSAPAASADGIDRHFRLLAERVDLLRQRTDDHLGVVRDDVARLTEAVLARPVASLDPDDRAALDALARRLDRAAAAGPETLDRLDILRDDLARLGEALMARPATALDADDRAALDEVSRTIRQIGRATPETLDRLETVQTDVSMLGRMLRDLDLGKRLQMLEIGQDAVLERIGTAAGTEAGPAIDDLRRRIDWIADRLERSSANEAVAAVEARIVRLAGDVQRLVEAPARAVADGGLARDVAAMRAELSELSRGGIVGQFDEIGSALARLAGEVKTAARSAGAETVPIVNDLVRRIERLDRRLDTLSAAPHPDDRLLKIERMIAALDRRLAEPRAADPRAAEFRAPAAAAEPREPLRRQAAAAEPFAVARQHAEKPYADTPPPAAASVMAGAPAAAPSRTSRLIAAARRAVEHPLLGGPVDAGEADAVAADTRPARAAASARQAGAPADTVVAFEPRPAAPAAPDFDALADVRAEHDDGTGDRVAGLSARRLALLAATVVILIGGAYGFASDPLRELAASFSAGEPAAVIATADDPATTGSISRPADTAPNGAAPFAVAAPPLPPAADIPPTLGSPSLRDAAAAGDPRAAFEIAVALIDGLGVQRDPAAALPWLTLAAESGLAPAEFRLGTLYERGIGVSRNRDTAKLWYDRAAGRGHVKAMHNLAVLLAEAGEGRDLARAVGWFEKAARHGLVDSQFNLAVLYVRGLGVAEDPVAAYRWFALAARQGDQEAGVRRDEIGKTLDPAARAAADDAIADWSPLPSDAAVNEGTPLPQAWTAGPVAAKG